MVDWEMDTRDQINAIIYEYLVLFGEDEGNVFNVSFVFAN